MIFWRVESINRGHKASSRGGCNFVPGDLLRLYFVERMWTSPQKPRAMYAVTLPSIMTPSSSLYSSLLVVEVVITCIALPPPTGRNQPAIPTPNSQSILRQLRLFGTELADRSLTPPGCLYPILYSVELLDKRALLLLLCLPRFAFESSKWNQWSRILSIRAP